MRVTVPTFLASRTNVATEGGPGCPPGTQCASYILFVPASNPSVGIFNPGGTGYTTPAPGPVSYEVNGRAYIPGGSGEPNCNPGSLFTPVTVTPGGGSPAATLSFTNCAP